MFSHADTLLTAGWTASSSPSTFQRVVNFSAVCLILFQPSVRVWGCRGLFTDWQRWGLICLFARWRQRCPLNHSISSTLRFQRWATRNLNELNEWGRATSCDKLQKWAELGAKRARSSGVLFFSYFFVFSAQFLPTFRRKSGRPINFLHRPTRRAEAEKKTAKSTPSSGARWDDIRQDRRPIRQWSTAVHRVKSHPKLLCSVAVQTKSFVIRRGLFLSKNRPCAKSSVRTVQSQSADILRAALFSALSRWPVSQIKKFKKIILENF